MSTTLYRLYDIQDRLLYVGISDRAFGRMREHERSQNWWLLAAKAEFTHFRTRADAETMERAMIERYHPPFNKAMNPKPGELEDFTPLLREIAPEVLLALNGVQVPKGPRVRTCENCRNLAQRLRRKRCDVCYTYVRRNGFDRPRDLIDGTNPDRRPGETLEAHEARVGNGGER